MPYRPMFRSIRGLFSKDISVDLGTANTLIYVRDQGIALREPSLVAVSHRQNNRRAIIAAGLEARRMLGRTPGNIDIIRPLRHGVIDDFGMTEGMLAYFIRKVHAGSIVPPSPRALFCVSCQSTGVEKIAIRKSARKAGARDIKLIEEPVAAALGANLPLNEAVGTMIVDIGGGTTEIAVLSLGGLAHATSMPIAGDSFDDAIVSHVRKTRGVLIGSATAEKIKHYLGLTGAEQGSIPEMQVLGLNLAKDIPASFTLDSREVCKALRDPLSRIVRSIRGVLSKTSPELIADVGERGVVLIGGSALLQGIDRWLSDQLSLPVIVAQDPLSCVARGGGKAWELLEREENYGFAFVR